MSDTKVKFMFFSGLIGFFLLWLGLLGSTTWTDRLIALGLAVVFVGIPVLMHHFSKEEKDWKSFGYLMGCEAVGALIVVGVGVGCSRCMEPAHHDYPYHDIETGRGQYDYGGSKEQAEQLIQADEYLTDEEKARQSDYDY